MISRVALLLGIFLACGVADIQEIPLPPASLKAAGVPRRLAVALVLISLAFLWFALINHLRIEWTVNAQYNYGWAVPFLCAYLGWRARQDGTSVTLAAIVSSLLSKTSGLVAVVLALLYAPTRLVQAANPEWRLVSWALAMIVVGLTLVFVHRVFGGRVLRWIVFPCLFFFVAVPWPTLVEAPLIQRLATFNASGAVEVLNLIGIPALRHGNVIEISAGLVGVEDACSGIRSFQACLMIGLFLGAYYRLRILDRVVLVGAGFLLAILFNLGRTVLLVAVASRKGIAAIAQWHDPAGVTILVGCFLGVWALSAMFARRVSASARCGEMAPRDPPRPASALALGFFLWLGVCEAGVEYWYVRHESRASVRPTWEVRLPAAAAGFRELPFEERTVQLLRFNEGRNAVWADGDGTRCQVIFLRWNPGRVAVHLARSHTPEVCLTSSGHKLASGTESRSVLVGGLSLAFDVYHAEREGLWVYYCLWEDGFSGDNNRTAMLTYGNRLRPVIEGRRNRGQRSLEIAVWSEAGADEIHSQVTRLLQSLVQVEPAAAVETSPAR